MAVSDFFYETPVFAGEALGSSPGISALAAPQDPNLLHEDAATDPCAILNVHIRSLFILRRRHSLALAV